MININRYNVVQGIITKDNELIPIWDSRLSYNKSSDLGRYLILNDGTKYFDLIEFIYDIKDKVCSIGIELDFIPVKTEFIVDEIILYEHKHNSYSEQRIKEIKFVDYTIQIIKGSKILDYYKKHFEGVIFEKESLYAIKTYQPTYILYNGEEVNYEYQLKHFIK